MSSHFTFPIRGDKLSMTVRVTNRLADVKSDFQRIEILDTDVFGKMLLLDGHIQLTEFDEHAYHESLVHPAVLSVPNAKRALVVGGGDGAVVRELCKHKNLEHIDLVDIDRMVIETCIQHMPSLQAGCLADMRVKTHITDAFEFVRKAEETYDIVVMDSTDVYEEEEGELSERLWTREFFSDVKRILSPQGILVTQADNIVFCPYSVKGILADFSQVFTHVGSYFALVPSFGGYSGFAWASDGGSLIAPDEANLNALGCRYLDHRTVSLGFGPIPFGE
jgi:spermidine synthase